MVAPFISKKIYPEKNMIGMKEINISNERKLYPSNGGILSFSENKNLTSKKQGRISRNDYVHQSEPYGTTFCRLTPNPSIPSSMMSPGLR